MGSRLLAVFDYLKVGERRFLVNLFTFLSGRGLAALITIGAMPLIARLYQPVDFGNSALFVAISMVLIPISCGAYDRAVVVAGDEDESRRLLYLSCVLAAIVAACIGLVVFAISTLGFRDGAIFELGGLLLLLPVVVVLGGWSSALSQWLIRQSRFRENATAEVLQSAARSALRLMAAIPFGSSLVSLIWSVVLAGILKFCYLVIRCNDVRMKWATRSPRRRIDEITDVATRYSDFPKYNLMTTLLLAGTAQLPTFLLGALFGPLTAGFFVMADRLINAPLSILGNSLRSVLLPMFSRNHAAGRDIRDQFLKVVIAIALVAIIPGLFIWFAGEELLTLLLGQKWQITGQYAEILAPFMVIALLTAPFHAAAQALRRQKSWFWLEMGTAAGRLLLIPAAIFLELSATQVLIGYTWISVLTRSLACLVVFHRVMTARVTPAKA